VNARCAARPDASRAVTHAGNQLEVKIAPMAARFYSSASLAVVDAV
jgi:hypothetical protein